MGRAIVRQPQAFLLDEPLSNLDAKLRVGMRASLAQLHQRLGVTTVYVTHDQIEAMTLGQRVAVMRDGQHPAGRHARSGSTAKPRRPLHRRLHRLARDEPRRGDVRRTAPSASASTACRSPRASAPPDGRVILGIRPGELRGRRASRPACRRSRSTVEVRRGARLRRPRLLPRSTRRRSPPRCSNRLRMRACCPPIAGALHRARRRPHAPPRSADRLAARGRPGALPVLRSATPGARLAPAGRGAAGSAACVQ